MGDYPSMYLLLIFPLVHCLTAAIVPEDRACVPEVIKNPFDPQPCTDEMWYTTGCSNENWFTIRNIKTSWALFNMGAVNVGMMPSFGSRGRWIGRQTPAVLDSCTSSTTL